MASEAPLGIGDATAEPRVHGELMALSSQIDRLEHQWERLAGRIDSVLGPELGKPDAGNVAMAPAGMSQVANQIRVLGERVSAVVEKMIETVDRVEV